MSRRSIPPIIIRSSHTRTPPQPTVPALPDPSPYILAFLATLFVLAWTYTFGLPLELEFLRRRVVRRSMGLLSWWSGSGGGSSGFKVGDLRLNSKTGAAGGRDQRRRGGDVVREAYTINGEAPEEGTYPGIVNMSGTFCFLNSVLQALASLPPFIAHLQTLRTLAETYDVPTPLIDALLPLLITLSTPSSSSYPQALRPTDLIEALTESSTFERAGMFGRLREQQDAQELWQLLVGAVDEERVKIEKEESLGRVGLRGLFGLKGDDGKDLDEQQQQRQAKTNPFEGTLAYRRSCTICGYSEGIRVTKLDNIQLPTPRKLSTSIGALLEARTSLEVLTDAQCRKCRIIQTYVGLKRRLPPPPSSAAELQTEVGDDKAVAPAPLSKAKKQRLREQRREWERQRDLILQVERLMNQGRWEDDVEGVEWELVEGGISTRQDMWSSPPPILTLHIQRSDFSSHYVSKNTCHITFPTLLNLTPFCTNGTLSLAPSSAISTQPRAPTLTSVLSGRSSGTSPSSAFTTVGAKGHPSSTTSAASAASALPSLPPQTLYRLSSAIFHFGSHQSGHYITYRRIPRTERWLRVSDDEVAELRGGAGDVVNSRGEVFMLFWERVEESGSEAAGGGERRGRSSSEGRVLRSVRLSGATSPTPSSSISQGEKAATEQEEEEMEGPNGAAAGEVIVTAAALKDESRLAPSEASAATSSSKGKKRKKKTKQGVGKNYGGGDEEPGGAIP